jgi:Domain of unknown function (DUF4845)
MNRETRTFSGRQRGVTMTGLLMGAALLGVVAFFVMKLFPDVTDYLAIVKDVKATAQDPASREMSVSDIRLAYSKRAEIDNIKGIDPADLEITKENGDVVIAFAYSRKIPLFLNASLVLDFEGSSAKK